MSTQPAPPDQTNRLLAALSYPIWIIALVIIFTDMKKDTFMRHHGWTALVWGIAWLVIYVALEFLPFPYGLGRLAGLVWVVLLIYYPIQAYNGKEVSIPIVSDMAKKYMTSV